MSVTINNKTDYEDITHPGILKNKANRRPLDRNSNHEIRDRFAILSVLRELRG